MANEGATEDQVLLLARPSSTSLDGGQALEAWFAGGCSLCGQEPETADHLFYGCVFARQLWYLLLHPLGLSGCLPGQADSLVNWWLRQRTCLMPEVHPSFDTIVLLAAWKLWKEQNNQTFRRQAASAPEVFLRLKQEAGEWLLAGYNSLASTLQFYSLPGVFL